MKNNVEDVWSTFWKPIIVKDNGQIDLDQLKKELFDYHTIMGEVARVYCHISGNRVSKPNTAAEVLISMYDEAVTQTPKEIVEYEAGE